MHTHTRALARRARTHTHTHTRTHSYTRRAAKVKEAMNDINAAQRLRVAALEKAEASKVGARRQARGVC